MGSHEQVAFSVPQLVWTKYTSIVQYKALSISQLNPKCQSQSQIQPPLVLSKSLSLLNPLNRTLLRLPIQPTPRILTDVLPPSMLRQPSRRLRPHTSLTIKQQLRIPRRPLKPIHVLEIRIRNMKALHSRRNRDIYSARNLARRLQLRRLADIYLR